MTRSGTGGLFERLYEELHGLASSCLRREARDHTLLPAAVVHEAWLRLRDDSRLVDASRSRFLAIAARAMRQVLVDHARRRRSLKRGDGWDRVTLSDVADDGIPLDAIALEAALARLAREHERSARIVELRFFAGLEEREIAQELGVSRTTVQGEWRFARAWLHREVRS